MFDVVEENRLEGLFEGIDGEDLHVTIVFGHEINEAEGRAELIVASAAVAKAAWSVRIPASVIPALAGEVVVVMGPAGAHGGEERADAASALSLSCLVLHVVVIIRVALAPEAAASAPLLLLRRCDLLLCHI